MLDDFKFPRPIDRLNFMLDDDVIPPVGYEVSLSRDEDMIVWKKALVENIKKTNYDSFYEPVVVKLKIPKNAAVLFTPNKCRASRAIVLGFYPCLYHGDELSQLNIPMAMSWYDRSFKYKLGKEVKPDYFNMDWRKTCSYGIHFFRTFEEAASYIF